MIFGRTTAMEYSAEETRIIVRFLRNEPLFWLLSSLWKSRRFSHVFAVRHGISGGVCGALEEVNLHGSEVSG